jgi:hypothetical protein
MSKLKDILIKELEQGNISDVFELIEENIHNKNISIKDMFLLNNLKNEFIFSGGNHTFYSRLLTFIQQNITDTIMAKSTKETDKLSIEETVIKEAPKKYKFWAAILLLLFGGSGIGYKIYDVVASGKTAETSATESSDTKSPKQESSNEVAQQSKFTLQFKAVDNQGSALPKDYSVELQEQSLVSDKADGTGFIAIRNVSPTKDKLITLVLTKEGKTIDTSPINLSNYDILDGKMDLGTVEFRIQIVANNNEKKK